LFLCELDGTVTITKCKTNLLCVSLEWNLNKHQTNN
jgi:hypothetical protein